MLEYLLKHLLLCSVLTSTISERVHRFLELKFFSYVPLVAFPFLTPRTMRVTYGIGAVGVHSKSPTGTTTPRVTVLRIRGLFRDPRCPLL